MRSILVLFVILLAACTSPQPAASPTDTPLPAAPTPIPLPATATEALAAFQAAGLEVERVEKMTDLPPDAIEGVKFYTPSLCDGCSSMVFVFANEAQALTTQGIFIEVGKTNEALRFWVYRQGPVLLRIGGLIDETEAKKYAAAVGL